MIPLIKSMIPHAKVVILSNYNWFQLEEKRKEDYAVSYLLKIDTPPSVLTEFVKNLLA